MNRRTLAMYNPEEVCQHDHVRFRGAHMPCTGPLICTMCGQLFDSAEEVKEARRLAAVIPQEKAIELFRQTFIVGPIR